GRLLASTSFHVSSAKMYSYSAQVLEALPTGQWKLLKDVGGTMLLNLRTLGDRVGYASFSGATDLVGVYDGTDWGALARLPQPMLHGMDVCAFRGKLYWSGSLRVTSAEELRENPDASKGLGVVYESADDGKTWKEIYRDKEPGRVQDLVVLKDRLYANRRGVSLLSWDGAAWKDLPVGVPTKPGDKALLGDGLLSVHQGAILAASNPLYYRFDGSKWTSHVPGFLKIFVDGDRAWGLRSDGHVYLSTDGVTWKKQTETGVPPDEFGPSKLHPLRRGSLAVWGGRIFVGTGTGGKIFASPVLAKGVYLSRARPTDSGSHLRWEADVPEGATLEMSVRTAPTEEGLAGAPWREAGEALEVPAGHRLLQYRASFGSDGSYSPVLKSVRWER
ncbi:MAG TPA: hypothetical protein VEN81_12840, partial [Planctomycetota bacterium]|nr:hypothetical protein [Planctomycetota bacterium]